MAETGTAAAYNVPPTQVAHLMGLASMDEKLLGKALVAINGRVDQQEMERATEKEERARTDETIADLQITCRALFEELVQQKSVVDQLKEEINTIKKERANAETTVNLQVRTVFEELVQQKSVVNQLKEENNTIKMELNTMKKELATEKKTELEHRAHTDENLANQQDTCRTLLDHDQLEADLPDMKLQDALWELEERLKELWVPGPKN
jgi:bifunctional pyridoxal-dependent enzyme with beta-cystathionase and maltose regulon repressor activities